MERLERSSPLPREMQGRWVDADDPTSELLIEGGEISCFGKVVEYDFRFQGNEDGAMIVSLKIDDDAGEDEFQRSNVTELVITPEGDFHAYNVKFSTRFIREFGSA